MKKILLLTFFISMNALANTDCCICETGQKNASGAYANFIEESLFVKGCQIILNQKTNCATKVIQTTNKKNIGIPKQCVGRNIDLSYVGHWDSGGVRQHHEMYSYYENVLVPLSKELNVDIYYNNTACLSASDHSLKMILESKKDHNEFIKLLESTGVSTVDVDQQKNIIIRGYQSVSVGVWGEVIKTYDNVWAEINTQTLKITYPLCSRYIGNTCDTNLHRVTKSDVFCVNDINQADPEELYKIKCCPKKINSDDLFSKVQKSTIGSWSNQCD